MSWRPEEGGYNLIFNRDESRRRSIAIPPAPQGSGEHRFLAGIDPDAGGTWLATTTEGTTFCLLNLYEAHARFEPARPRSRGLLVADLASGATEIPAITASSYRPFLLAQVSLPCTATVWKWDGQSIATTPISLPITTSSFETDAVRAWRTTRFHRLEQRQFHFLHAPDAPEYAPRMIRADASTVSITEIESRPGSVRSRYSTPPDFDAPLMASL